MYSYGIWKNDDFNKGRIYFKNGIDEEEIKNDSISENGKMKYKMICTHLIFFFH